MRRPCLDAPLVELVCKQARDDFPQPAISRVALVVAVPVYLQVDAGRAQGRLRDAVQTVTLLALRAVGVMDARARGLVVQAVLPAKALVGA